MRLPTLLPILLVAAVLPARAADPLKGKIAYSRKEGDRYVLHVMNADGTGDKELPGQTQKLNFLPAVSPDGKRIAYMAGESFEAGAFQLVLAKIDGSEPRTVNTGQEMNGIPAWSPDGKRLAFVAGNRDRPGVYVADADGNGMRQLSDGEAGGMFPFWLPDNETVIYTRFAPGEMKSSLVRKKIDAASELVVEGEALMFAQGGALSPDGKRFTYAALRPEGQAGSVSIRIRDLDGKSESSIIEVPLKLGDSPDMLSLPCWAPEGKGLIVTLPTEKGSAIYHLAEDGQKRQLSAEGLVCATVAWFAG